MQDKLKQYIEEHREAFEVHEPRELWDGVNERLQQGRSGTMWQRLAIAASVLLVVTCSTWIYIARHDSRIAGTGLHTQPPVTNEEIYLTAIVHAKDAELEAYCRPQPELCRAFEQDIVTLNKAYYRLKNEYAAAADKERILQAMMTNLQLQVQLVNRQLQIMRSVKQKKEELRTI